MNYLDINTIELKNIILETAHEELMTRFTRISHEHKADGSIVTEADLSAQEQISRKLLQTWPETVLLGEEMAPEEQAEILTSDKPVWCLDPLDGTSNFAAGIPYFAISLTLIAHGEVVMGLVYDPNRDECFFARREADGSVSVSLNEEPLQVQNCDIELSRATAIVDFKRLSDELASRIVTERPFASQRNFGASALDWCWLATSRGHVYLHGNQNLWDYAAGELIFTAAGGKAVTLEGESIYRKALEKRSVVAAINEELFREWTTWLNVPA